MIFRAQQFELYKADGRTVCGIGVEWTEARTFLEGALRWLANAFFVLSVFAGYGAFALSGAAGAGASALWLTAAILLAVLGWATMRASMNMAGRVRWMEFRQDGRMTASWDQVVWKLRVEDFRNIEAEQHRPNTTGNASEYTHGVRFITRHGKTFRIAHNMTADDARQLAVVLTDAIESVRVPPVRPALSGQPAAVW